MNIDKRLQSGDSMRKTRSLPVLVLVFIAFAIVLTLGFAGWREWVARNEQVRETQTFLANLASSLTQHAEDTIEITDTVLASLVERLETDGTAPPALARLDRIISDRSAVEPRFRYISILGQDGHRLSGSLPGKDSDNADREYSRHHRDDPDRQAFIGPLIQSRSTGHWVVTVSRRFQSADGSFAGVVVAVIDVSYFVDHYAGYNLGPNSVITLLTTGGTLLARSPWDEQSIGRVFSGGVFGELRERPVGSYETTSVIDGIRRFGGYRRSERYPLVVAVSMSKGYALGAWRADACIHMGIAAVLAGILWLLGWDLVRQVNRGHAAEEQTRRSEARYRSMAESLQEANERATLATDSGAIGLWEWEVAPDRMTWDARMYQLLGMQSRDMPTYALWKRQVHPDDCAAAEKAVRDALEGTGPYNSEFRAIWDDGSVHYIRGSGRVIRDASGSVIRMIGANWDVTEARQLTMELVRQAERLSESEANFRLLADNMSDLIIRIGPDGMRLYVSPASIRIFGTSPEALVGRNVLDSIHPDDLATVAVFWTQLSEANEEGKITYRVLHPDRDVWVEASMRPVTNSRTNAPDGYVSTLRDVTEREHELRTANTKLESLARHLVRARDVAERSNRAKSRFLAGMSHELRTPLNGILGYGHLLHMEGGLTPAQEARVDAMLKAGKHLLEMIICVLDLSEVEAEHVELHMVNTDVQAVAAACLDLVRSAADAKRLALDVVVAPGTRPELLTDPVRLRQVLLNMLGNAVKFTDQGAVQLRLRTLADGSALRIEVADTGPGILPEQHQRLFRHFEPLDNEETRVAEGPGLGLAFAARLAALMGGRLDHEDNPGGGSVFWLELPLDARSLPTPAMAPASTISDTEPAPAPGRVLHVLVVDDVLMNRDIASSFLRTAGHNVLCAEGGAEAVAAVVSIDFDVVLMDVRMPEMDGLEATRRIRALEGARGQVPIIAFTAQAFTDQIAECRKAGMNSHVAKPFDLDTLLAAVLSAVEPRQAQEERFSIELISASTKSIMIAAPPIPAIGEELLVLNPIAFERTAAFLAPEAVVSYLKTIVERGEELLHGLHEPDALTSNRNKLATAAHALAGSAGMFGFERVAAVGRRFERAVHSDGADAPALADGLTAVLKATLREIHDRISASVEGS